MFSHPIALSISHTSAMQLEHVHYILQLQCKTLLYCSVNHTIVIACVCLTCTYFYTFLICSVATMLLNSKLVGLSHYTCTKKPNILFQNCVKLHKLQAVQGCIIFNLLQDGQLEICHLRGVWAIRTPVANNFMGLWSHSLVQQTQK